jgi:bacteriorhodopsin
MVFLYADSAGRDVFWSVFAVMAFASFCFGLLTLRLPQSSLLTHHMHHYLTWAVVTIAMIAYYAMAAEGGYKYVLVQGSSGQSRTIYYARYIDWCLTTPLLLLDLVLLGNMTFRHTFRIIFFDLAMILCGLFGALEAVDYKWGWYAMGCVFMFLVFYELLVNVRLQTLARSPGIGMLYNGLAVYLITLWMIYPIIWALAEGSNTIAVDAEIACYGALDLLTKVVFGTILLMTVGRFSTPMETMMGTKAAAMDGPGVGAGTPAVAAQPTTADSVPTQTV